MRRDRRRRKREKDRGRVENKDIVSCTHSGGGIYTVRVRACRLHGRSAADANESLS